MSTTTTAADVTANASGTSHSHSHVHARGLVAAVAMSIALLAGCVAPASTPGGETEPERAAPRTAVVRNEAPVALPEPLCVFDFPGHTIELDRLLDRAAADGGFVVLHDENTAEQRSKSVELIGRHSIPRSRLFEWLQAVCAYYRIALVPVGPHGPDTPPTYFCVAVDH